MKKTLLPLLLTGLFVTLRGAEPWIVSIDANVTMTMNMYSKNWEGGEQSALSWAAQSNAVAEKQLHPKLRNKNTLKLAFGQTKTKDGERWSAPKKSTDRIDLEGLLQLTLGGWVDPYIAARIVSQFYDISDSLATRYVNPVEITESFGALRDLVKNDRTSFTVRLGGAVRQLIDRDKFVRLDTLDNDSIRQIRQTDITNDAGVELVSELTTAIVEDRLKYSMILKVYEAVWNSEAEALEGTPEETFWRYPDVTWEHTVVVSITKYIMINLYLQMLYDRQIDTDPRLKNTLAVGLSYSFKNAPAKEAEAE
jgi:hypothetical protein